MVPINLFAVLVSAIVAMILGYLWYGPFFGKTWTRLMDITPEMMKGGQGSMGKMYGIMFVGALIMAYVLAGVHIFAASYLNIGGIGSGALAGFMSWLGFAGPITVNYALTGPHKAFKLWLITTGYYLVTLVLMGIILAAWA
ncbi:MAG: hypothetical protein JWL88_262 [Parcubacteria group bacterium]|nr:hypothetical protein [Parcubacteria group bacterium]